MSDLSIHAELARTTEVARTLLGLRLDAAVARGTSAGCSVRLVREDDTDHICTADLNPRRIDLEVERGVVTRTVAG